jgi:hypothetical protein
MVRRLGGEIGLLNHWKKGDERPGSDHFGATYSALKPSIKNRCGQSVVYTTSLLQPDGRRIPAGVHEVVGGRARNSTFWRSGPQADFGSLALCADASRGRDAYAA